MVTSPLIEVGDYSYYDDPKNPTAFETSNVLYHYGPAAPIRGQRLLSATIAAIRTCGSPLCRGVVTGEDRKRPELQARYGDHWIPALLRKQRAG